MRATQPAHSSGTSAHVDDAISILISACEALSAGASIGPITISLPATFVGERALRKLAYRIAERYDLLVDIEPKGLRTAVRLQKRGGL